jgi:hypothetical protein
MSGQPLPYSQTVLLDCNSRQSVEFSASNLAPTNNALFTNQISSGITLDIGDTVSIQSAHISQRGAGGDIIEFSGNVLGQKNISYTETTSDIHIGLGIYTFDPGLGPMGRMQTSPTGFAMERSENITEEIQEKDNEANIVISYYKNANGENNIGLPRNFGSASSIGINATAGSHIYYDLPTNASYWEVPDGYPVGANTYPQSASHVSSQDWNIVGGINASGEPCRFRKLKQDNSRYTLFKQKYIIWNQNYLPQTAAGELLLIEYMWNEANASQASNLYKSDPATHPYIKYKQKVPLSVPVGFNSPESVAADLTNQLTKTDDPIFIDPLGSSAAESVIVNSTTNKAFPCTNFGLFSASMAHSYFRATNIPEQFPQDAVGPPFIFSEPEENQSVQYLNSYAYVGFKRPEIVEAGRAAFMPQGADTLFTIPISNASSAEIATNIPWNDENLRKLKAFFDAQALYPELFKGVISDRYNQTNYSASVNPESASLSGSFAEEARFLHIDLKKQGDGPVGDPIGDDMYNSSHSSNAAVPIQQPQQPDRSSAPIFIAYNKNSSHLNGSEAEGTSYEQLAFGFAKKINIGSVANPILFIGFTTERIGGIVTTYFAEQVDQIQGKTKIGYDYHFNAFGNAAIIPSSGFHPLQYFGQQRFTGAQTIRNVYIGANDPVYKFNAVDGRFEFENLHTSEKVGNFYNAGDPNPTDTVFAPPESAQAGQDCYKINKQLHYTSWSPSMYPYSNIQIRDNNPHGADKAITNQKTFVKVNPNLDIGRIYDSHGGITLEDMGYDEKNWSQGFWGLCGFEYGQFNASGANQKNRLIKYNNDSSNVNGMTTNADITSVDSQSYITNIYGANLYSQMLDSRLNYYTASQTLATVDKVSASNAAVSPASVILANSTRITANDLPRRLLRGYFLLKSDILDQANYYETSNPLATMGIIGKYNGNDDFIQYDGGGPTFTCTRKKTITSIQTQILDPEGQLAQCGDNSGVIYRVDKNINTDLKFGENLFASMNAKK